LSLQPPSYRPISFINERPLQANVIYTLYVHYICGGVALLRNKVNNKSLHGAAPRYFIGFEMLSFIAALLTHLPPNHLHVAAAAAAAADEPSVDSQQPLSNCEPTTEPVHHHVKKSSHPTCSRHRRLYALY